MAEGTGRFTLSASMAGTALVVRLNGEIDLSSADAARTALLGAASALPPPDLAVLDMSAVSLLSAAGVHAVQAFAVACAGRGVRTHLVVDPESIASRVVRMSGLDDRLPMFTELGRAL